MIKHVKQRCIGMLLTIIPIVFSDVFIEYDAGIAIVMFVGAGLYYLCTEKKLLDTDYTFRGDRLGL